VDLTASGLTLQENGLVVREEIATVTARLVANRVAHRLKAVGIEEFASLISAAPDAQAAEA